MADFPERSRFEKELEGLLLPLAEKHRRKLIRLMGNPPDASRVPAEFWEEVRREQEETLLAILLLIFATSSVFQGAQEQQAQQSAAAYAATAAARTATEYATRSRELAAGLAQEAEQARRQAAAGVKDAAPLDRQTIRLKFEQIFGPDRVRRIAVTETTKAATAGGENGASLTRGISLDDIWWTENDARVCPICAPLHKRTRQEWGSIVPSGPPAHPMCRCWIEYRGRFRNRPTPVP